MRRTDHAGPVGQAKDVYFILSEVGIHQRVLSRGVM